MEKTQSRYQREGIPLTETNRLTHVRIFIEQKRAVGVTRPARRGFLEAEEHRKTSENTALLLRNIFYCKPVPQVVEETYFLSNKNCRSLKLNAQENIAI